MIGAVKRRIAATAASAALAVAGPAVAADRSARGGHQPRSAKPRVTRVAEAEQTQAQQQLAVARREEMNAHRHQLATALAAELPATTTARIERGLAGTGTDPAVLLADSTGRSVAEIDAAFEAMARHAREARLRT